MCAGCSHFQQSFRARTEWSFTMRSHSLRELLFGVNVNAEGVSEIEWDRDWKSDWESKRERGERKSSWNGYGVCIRKDWMQSLNEYTGRLRSYIVPETSSVWPPTRPAPSEFHCVACCYSFNYAWCDIARQQVPLSLWPCSLLRKWLPHSICLCVCKFDGDDF